jgi:integrase
MAQDKTTLRFWLRTDKPNQDGSAPVHLIYQIKGDRKYYAIPGVKVFPVNWDAKEQKAVYRSKKQAKETDPKADYSRLLSENDVDKINEVLLNVKNNVADIEREYKKAKVAIDVEMVINKLKSAKEPETKKIDAKTNIADFIINYIKEANQFKEGTLKEYKTLANHIKDFEANKRVKFSFETIDVHQIKAFQSYLLEEKIEVSKKGKKRTVQLNNITVAKLLSTLKTLLRRAEAEYDIAVNPKYKNFKNQHPKKDSELEVIALTEDELLAIWELDLSDNKRLDEARDIYCFSCATGFRYGDLAQLKRHHIKKDNVIRMASSDKNSKKIEVPLNPISFAIIQKYADRYKPLPVTAKGKILSNQKLNDYIKEIGKLAGINTSVEIVREAGTKKIANEYDKWELLSIHTGRKTFTTLSLAKGMAIQEVMALTTHSSFAAVKRYIDVTKERKKTVMAQAWGPVNPLKVAN